MKRIALLSLIVLASLGAVGCLNVGKRFPVDEVPNLTIGKTTRDDVRQMFGEPWRTGIEDGKRTWTYGRYRYSLVGPAETRDLVGRFDQTGAVVSYSFNSTFEEDRNL